MLSKLRIGSDIDEVLADWWNPYLERFGFPKNDYEITRNCTRKLAKDREFWLNLPVLRRFEGFEPELYCTKRSCLKTYSKEWIYNNGFPNKPVYQVLCQFSNKANYIKGRVDLFVDDSIRNFIQMNLSGLPCLLMDHPNNQSWGPIGRIYSLNYDEIEEAYYLFKYSFFENFKELLNDC